MHLGLGLSSERQLTSTFRTFQAFYQATLELCLLGHTTSKHQLSKLDMHCIAHEAQLEPPLSKIHLSTHLQILMCSMVEPT